MTDSILHPRETAEAPLTVTVRVRDQVLVLVLSGELDLASCPLLQDSIDAIDSAFREVELDLTRLRFMDSTGIGLIARTHQRFGPEYRVLTLRCVDGPVRRVLALSGVDQIVNLIADG